MKHIPDSIYHLVQKYLDGTASAEEKAAVDEWYSAVEEDELLVVSAGETERSFGYRLRNRLKRTLNEDRRLSVFVKYPFTRIAAAFTGIVLIAGLYYFFSGSDKHVQPAPPAISVVSVTDLAPGSNKAILTLGDGTTVTLDSSSQGTLGVQGNSKVIKLASGELQYKKGAHGKDDGHEVVYNHVATPRGGQYAVVLADGSRVWLNASSSIRFPADFRDSVREVEITGEAYFEVAHNPAKPFKVKINNTSIRVLGTHFNIMGYTNEGSINTTLLQGSLMVESNSSSRLLVPGNQARVDKAGMMQLVKNADTEEAVAWRTGKFLFNSADMYSIMRQVERWYNVDVKFEGNIGLHFSGQLNRYANASELLRKLELTNEVHFKIAKGEIIVLPGSRASDSN